MKTAHFQVIEIGFVPVGFSDGLDGITRGEGFGRGAWALWAQRIGVEGIRRRNLAERRSRSFTFIGMSYSFRGSILPMRSKSRITHKRCTNLRSSRELYGIRLALPYSLSSGNSDAVTDPVPLVSLRLLPLRPPFPNVTVGRVTGRRDPTKRTTANVRQVS
jgi:hypothetical protein